MRNIRGGVNPDVARKERPIERPVRAEIMRRSDDVDRSRARLKLSRQFLVRIGERLLLDSDYETIAVDVYALHTAHLLIDVHLRAPLDERACKVTLRRSPMR